MFATFDSAAGLNGRPKTAADRACDQCKHRKVACNMANPCTTCSTRSFECTYTVARKKRGPIGRRISHLQRMQAKRDQDCLDLRRMASTPASVPQTSPSAHSDGLDLHRVSTVSSSGTVVDRPNGQSAQLAWPAAPTQPGDDRSMNDETSFGAGFDPNFVFPSLPMDSPPDAYNLFASMPEQELFAAESVEFWPRSINQETLLPWIDVYFKRLHPTIPLLNRTMIYQEMLMRRHHIDRQFGAMLLALCAFAMTQPVQIHEVASAPSRSAQARMLLEESVRMRMAVDFGEDPSIHMVLASFFLFACLFGSGQHKAARHRLREAVDLANALGLHMPQAYEGLNDDTREQWLRTYLVLSVTERAYALQKRHSIDFRGSPALNAKFMRALYPSTEPSLAANDNSETMSMTGLLYLMDTFDAIDESVVECWNGFCKYSDGSCESFDRRRAVQMFRAQHKVREACQAGSLSFTPSTNPLPLSQLLETQRADIVVTQLWLLNRLWNLCLLHGLLRDVSDHPELRYAYACHIARELAKGCEELSLPAMEVHGVGLVEKLYDITLGVITCLSLTPNITLDSPVPYWSIDGIAMAEDHTTRSLLQILEAQICHFRGGDHEYAARTTSTLADLAGYSITAR